MNTCALIIEILEEFGYKRATMISVDLVKPNSIENLKSVDRVGRRWR